jgi:hypothetical protein
MECGTVEVEPLLRGEDLSRNGRQWRRREVEIPVFDPLGGQEMLVGVFMG